MFKNKTVSLNGQEEGVTLIELLIVIALVGLVAAIAVSIIIPVNAGAQAAADKDTQTNLAQFVNQWSQSGYTVSYIGSTDSTMGTRYENTEIAYTDLNGNGMPDPGEPIIAYISGHYTG